jgi:hypothetical protein
MSSTLAATIRPPETGVSADPAGGAEDGVHESATSKTAKVSASDRRMATSRASRDRRPRRGSHDITAGGKWEGVAS